MAKHRKKNNHTNNDTCPRCKGTGKILEEQISRKGNTHIETVRCDLCQGSGKKR